MIREEKIEFTAKWCKYDKYIIEKNDEKYYILPDKNAKPSTYNPFEVKNQILKDLLTIGKESVENEMYKIGDREVSIEAQSKMEKFQNLVLEFVTNYGLLGNFRYLPENYEFMEEYGFAVTKGVFSEMFERVKRGQMSDGCSDLVQLCHDAKVEHDN